MLGTSSKNILQNGGLINGDESHGIESVSKTISTVAAKQKGGVYPPCMNSKAISDFRM